MVTVVVVCVHRSVCLLGDISLLKPSIASQTILHSQCVIHVCGHTCNVIEANVQ